MTPAFPAALRIETERLIIRRFAKEDGDAFFDIFSDPVTCSDDGDYDAFTVRDEAFDDLMAQFALDPSRYAIVLRETGVMIAENPLEEPLEERYGDFVRDRQYRYGKIRITTFRHKDYML